MILQREDNVRKYFAKVRSEITNDQKKVDRLMQLIKKHPVGPAIETMFQRLLSDEEGLSYINEIALLSNIESRRQLREIAGLLDESNFEHRDRFHQFKHKLQEQDRKIDEKLGKVDVDKFLDEHFKKSQRKVGDKHDN